MRVNPHAGVGAGRFRKPWRIKEWMATQGLEQADIAKAAGLKSHSAVSRTIWGGLNNRKVLRALISLGCPESFLSLPKDMKQLEQ